MQRSSIAVKRKTSTLTKIVCLLLAISSPPDSALGFETERVASGLARPIYLTAPPGDTERAFILEQHTGRIRILDLASRTVSGTDFLTISGLPTGDEQGLLGLAFHPDYADNGYFFVYVTDPMSRVLRFQVSGNPDVADAGSEIQLLEILQPKASHNAGWLGFGPDDLLYIALGDGGCCHDDGTGHTSGTGNAQDLTDNLLGKILRIDVNGDDFPADATRNYAIPADNPFVGATEDDEIWAYGLRNPWRSSFDRGTGDLYIADVGQGSCEELNVQPASSPGGENYGWRLREGIIATPSGGVGGAAPPAAMDPVMVYPHPFVGPTCAGPETGLVGNAVTGGYVYRGPEAEFYGRYFFSDHVSGGIHSLRFDGAAPADHDGTNYTELTDHSAEPRFLPDLGSIDGVSSFGEDGLGNLYVIDLADGEIFWIPEPTPIAQTVAGLLGLAALAWRRTRH